MFDLLEKRVFKELLAESQRLDERIPPGFQGWVVIDEIQKIPDLLNEVHRLIEGRKLKFVLTGSSARKLRRGGVNLLAGRALSMAMHPFTAVELGGDFDLGRAVRHGLLPTVLAGADPETGLASYVYTYLEEEVRQEGLTRNLSDFARFLEAASFSQGALLNMAAVARECAVERKVVEGYFGILEDLMLARRIPAFTRRSRRRVQVHPKFYFFDAGVFRALRPKGPLDSLEEADGPAFETVLLQNMAAVNDALGLGYAIHHWRAMDGHEVDFVLYGKRGLLAIEVKRRAQADRTDGRGLKAFLKDYPIAKAYLVYGGAHRLYFDGFQAWPMADFLMKLPEILSGAGNADA
jgi:predicted AAA+ superfamily ATPase